MRRLSFTVHELSRNHVLLEGELVKVFDYLERLN